MASLNDLRWNFGNESGSDDGPNDAMAENFNSKPISSLVREVIQNSLDAVYDKGKPVVVSFDYKLLSSEKCSTLLEIRNHIDECLKTYSDNENALEFFPPMLDYLNTVDRQGQISCLKVSDYNTTGMEYVENSTKSPFYAFVRSKGVTVKNSNSSGGSFGFGKAAYFGMSKIKTVLISTRTANNEIFFEGVSTLCTHMNNEGNKLTAVGFFDNQGGLRPIRNDLQMPEGFLREKDAYGTDFWIVGCNNEASNFEKMIKATLVNFWLAIYRNELEVVIEGTKINYLNLEILLKEYFPADFDKTSSNRDTYNPRPYLDAVKNGEKNDSIFKCIKKNGLSKLGTVSFYAKLDTEGSSKIVCARKPKMLVQLLQGRPVGFYGVFVCEDEKGNKNLQRMENPAHTSWNKGRKADSKVVYEEFEKFIKECIDNLRPVGQRKSIDVIGLDQFMGIPERLLPKGIDLSDSNRGTSNPSGGKSDDNSGNRKPRNRHSLDDKTTTTATTVEVIGADSGEGDDTVESSGGKNNGTGGTDTGRGNNHSRGSKSNNGQKKYADEIGIDLFQIAKKVNGRTVHILKINSKKTVSNASVSILSIGDNEKEEPSIKYTVPNYTVEGNVIKNVSLSIGLNVVEVYFSDNMIRSLRIFVNK